LAANQDAVASAALNAAFGANSVSLSVPLGTGDQAVAVGTIVINTVTPVTECETDPYPREGQIGSPAQRAASCV